MRALRRTDGTWPAFPHSEVDVPFADPVTGWLVILPEEVAFISYPFEWSPGQLLDAAEATLEIQRIAVGHGMSLRDASALNIQFVRGRPVLIDTLSFEILSEGAPWIAYGQFCRHFLAPLALIRHVDVRSLQLLRVHVDGIPLDLASHMLPWRTRLRWGLAIHVHAHAATQRRQPEKAPRSGAQSGKRFSRTALSGLVESLRAVVRKQAWNPPPSAWRDYYSLQESYTSGGATGKRLLLEKTLTGMEVATVWDLEPTPASSPPSPRR